MSVFSTRSFFRVIWSRTGSCYHSALYRIPDFRIWKIFPRIRDYSLDFWLKFELYENKVSYFMPFCPRSWLTFFMCPNFEKVIFTVKLQKWHVFVFEPSFSIPRPRRHCFRFELWKKSGFRRPVKPTVIPPIESTGRYLVKYFHNNNCYSNFGSKWFSRSNRHLIKNTDFTCLIYRLGCFYLSEDCKGQLLWLIWTPTSCRR